MAIATDLQQLFLLQGETLSTEFKGWLDLSKPEGRAILAKAAIALANHGGGTIIMGMREAKDKPIGSTSRPTTMRRYTTDAINAAVNKYAEPHIHCDVIHIKHPETGHEHAFIVVPSGTTVPIMSVKDLPGTIASQRCYIRKPGPKSEEPFTAEEWRTLLSRCLQAGRETMLDSIRAILQGHSLNPIVQAQEDQLLEFANASRARWLERIDSLPKDDSARFLHGYYEQAFHIEGVEPAGGLKELRERLRKAGEVRLTGWGPFVDLERKPIGPVPAGDVVEAWIGHPDEAQRDGRHADFWRARPDGMLYEIRSFDEDFTEKAKPGTVIDYSIPVWRIGETLLFVSRAARLFGDDPEVTMRVHYTGLKGRFMRSVFDWKYPSYPRECFVDSVTLQGSARASVIDENLVEVLLPLLKPLYEAFDFAPLTAEMVTHEVTELRKNRY